MAMRWVRVLGSSVVAIVLLAIAVPVLLVVALWVGFTLHSWRNDDSGGRTPVPEYGEAPPPEDWTPRTPPPREPLDVPSLMSELDLPPRAPSPPPATLGVGYERAVAGLAGDFEMESSPLDDGTPRHFGAGVRGTLEFVGDPSDLSRVTAALDFPPATPDDEGANEAILRRVLDNTMPAGDAKVAAEWLVRRVRSMAGGPMPQRHASTFGPARVEVSSTAEPGGGGGATLRLTITPKDAPAARD